MKWLLADWRDNKKHIFDGVAAGLRALGHGVSSIARDDMARRPELLAAIAGGEYDALLTWQRFYGMQQDILAALAASRIRTVFMDFGFSPHYESVVFDISGENAVSSWPSIWASGDPPAVEKEYEEAAERLLEELGARLGRLECPLGEAGHSLRMPFVFVPLQRPHDSVVRYDSSVHDFGELCRRVLFLAHGRCFVVIKTHPLDSGLSLGVPDRVEGSHLVLRGGFGGQNEAICDWLLGRASLVVGVNSNMLFRAICFGIPVIAAGRGWYSGSGVVHEVDGIPGLRGMQVPTPDRAARVRYVSMCLSRQLVFKELSDSDKLQRLLGRLGVLEGVQESIA